MWCPGQGLAAGSATRQGAKPLFSSQQAHGTREEEDKDVRTSNYTPGTCEIGALEVLATNDAPRCCRGAQEKEEHSGGSEGWTDLLSSSCDGICRGFFPGMHKAHVQLCISQNPACSVI